MAARKKRKKAKRQTAIYEKDRRRGRPTSFDNVEDFMEAVNEYFDLCLLGRHKKYKYKVYADLPTKNGLAYYLDISRETLNQYSKKPEYSDAIKKAYDRIEEAWVQQLSKAYPTGAIFYLKNAFRNNWKDRWEVTGEDGGPIAIKTIIVRARK